MLEQHDASSSEENDDDDVAIVSAPPQFVVCFDFDQCLMKGHWWGKHKNNPLDTISPQPSDFAHDDIGDLFRRLAAIEGVKLAVASFGRRDVIHKALVSAVGAELADHFYITTPGDFEGCVITSPAFCYVPLLCPMWVLLAGSRSVL